MSEYIKREDAEQSIVGYFTPKTYDGNDVDRAFKIAGAILNNIPSADVVEARQGHWKIIHPKYLRLDRRTDMLECSECGHHIFRRTGEIVNYCPNCGARMIPKEQEHE